MTSTEAKALGTGLLSYTGGWIAAASIAQNEA